MGKLLAIMKPKENPKRLTQVFVPFTNFAAAIREKLRGLRQLPDVVTKGREDDKKTVPRKKGVKKAKSKLAKAVNVEAIKKMTEMNTLSNKSHSGSAENIATEDDNKKNASDMERNLVVNAFTKAEKSNALKEAKKKPRAVKKPRKSSIFQGIPLRSFGSKRTFIMFKAASKQKKQRDKDVEIGIRPATDTNPKTNNIDQADKNTKSQIISLAARRARLKRKRKAVQTRAKFINKMKRIRGIQHVIHKRSAGSKFTLNLPSLSRSPCNELITVSPIHNSFRKKRLRLSQPHGLRTRSHLVSEQRTRFLRRNAGSLNYLKPGVRLSLRERIAKNLEAYSK